MTQISKTLELERLKKLKDDGVLTDDEYQTLKKRIIDGDDLDAGQEEAPVRGTPRLGGALKKSSNSLFISGIISFVVVIAIAGLFFMPGKKKETGESAQAASEPVDEVAADPKAALVQAISGVWSNSGKLTYFVYNEGKLQFIHNDVNLNARLGDIDPLNETVNILVHNKKTNKETTWALKRVWTPDRTSAILRLTGEGGAQDNLSFIRSISSDELNQIIQQASAQAGTPKAPEAKTVTISNDNVLGIAKQYAGDAMSAPRADSLKSYYANVVKYYGKGEVPLVEVIDDKKAVLRQMAAEKEHADQRHHHL